MDEDQKIMNLFRRDDRPVAQLFTQLANQIMRELPKGSTKTLTLIKLMEAKDWAMRTSL